MEVGEIIRLPHPWDSHIPENIDEAVEFVRFSESADIRGSVRAMAEQLRLKREKGDYMGGTSTDLRKCIADANRLLARVLLDTCEGGKVGGFPQQVYQRIRDNAIDIAGRETWKDDVSNWHAAQTEYAKAGLNYLGILISSAETQPH
jgi:hypothetical protein